MDTTSEGTAGQQNPRRNLDFSSLRVKRSNKSWEEHQRGAWSSSSARDFSRSETSGKEEADAAVARLHSSEACTTRAGTNPRLHSSEACTTRAGTNPRLHSSEACTTQAGTNPRLHSSKACTTQAGTNPRLHSSEACTTQAGTNPRLHSSEACTTQAGTNPRLHSSKACTTQAGEPPKSSVISDCGGTVPREDGGGRPKALKRLSAMWSSFRKGKIDRVKEQDPVEARPILEEKASRQPRFVSGQYFFEYLVVVSLKKNKDGSNYEPQITYQFPKRDGMGRSQKEEEERTLKAITLFCFPEGIKWAPLTEYHSETFSFVLTELDGSRRNGYCRRLLPGGRGARPPEAYCIISSLACFGLFSEIFDEVEKRRQISMAMIYPFMQKLREAPFPAPGNTVEIKSFIPESGTEIIRLTRPLDSWLEHVNFPVLFSCLTDEEVLLVFAAAVLERRIIFIADDLGTLSQVIHAVAALLYPFTWQHTLISIVPSILIDVVMAPTPYLLGVQKRLLDQVTEQNDMLLVDLSQDKEETFIVSVGDEPSILPPKLQSEILEALIERKKASSTEDVNRVVSEAFLLFFVKTVGHYTSYVKRGVFEKRSFYKAIESKTTRHFVKKFIQTQMFDLFIQEVEQQDTGPQQGIFHKKIVEYQKMKKAKTKKH